MARSKSYKAREEHSPHDVGLVPGAIPESFVVDLPFTSSTTLKKIDLSRWRGKGFDEWVEASVVALRGRLSGGFAVATVASMGTCGIAKFFAFLAEGGIKGIPTRPQDLRGLDVKRYIAWLNRTYTNAKTKNCYYANFKALILALDEYGFGADRGEDWLVENPFPSRDWEPSASTSLSTEEMRRFASALKLDLIAIHRKTFKEAESITICIPFLILALRSGINLTPLLEMSRDSLRPHPVMPNMMLLDTTKRRGSGKQSSMLRKGEDVESATAIPMDGVGVLKKALEMTSGLAKTAPNPLQDRVWLFSRGGEVNCASPNILAHAIKSVVRRHGLLSDGGAVLNVNMRVIRQTKANLLWRLTDGDIAAVASVMGHSPKVADDHYLKLDERSKAEGAMFIGEAFVEGLRTSDLTPTPTGSCKDSLGGVFAPKDGKTHCSDFMSCLSCPSYAIVGSVSDLHRLFSFQIFLRKEMSELESAEWNEWRSQRQRVCDHVDKVADDNFPKSIVDEAKALAKKKPHPFWAVKMQKESMGGEGGVHG